MRFPVAPYPHQHLVVVVSVFWILTILIGVLCISLLFYKNILILFSINILFFSQGMACFFLFSCRLFYCFHLSKVISLFDYWFCCQVFLEIFSFICFGNLVCVFIFSGKLFSSSISFLSFSFLFLSSYSSPVWWLNFLLSWLPRAS